MESVNCEMRDKLYVLLHLWSAAGWRIMLLPVLVFLLYEVLLWSTPFWIRRNYPRVYSDFVFSFKSFYARWVFGWLTTGSSTHLNGLKATLRRHQFSPGLSNFSTNKSSTIIIMSTMCNHNNSSHSGYKLACTMAYKIKLDNWKSITNVVWVENYENHVKTNSTVSSVLHKAVIKSEYWNMGLCETWRTTRQKIKCLEMKLNQIDSQASPSHCDSQHGTNLFWTWILLDTPAFCLLVFVWQARLDAN